MTTAHINSTTIWYHTIGDGVPVLVMHGGLGVDHTMYRDLDVLSDQARLIYYDHRCNGRSGRPNLETLTIQQLADDADALLDELGISKACVFGHSYGGFVAQEFALRHPGRTQGLLLIDTTPGQLGTGETGQQGPPMPPELGEMMRSLPSSDAELAAAMTKMAPYYVKGDTGRLLAAIDATIFNAAAMVRSMQVLAEWSSFDRLSRIAAPALVMAGRHDHFTSYPQSIRIASQVSAADLVILDRSGHFPWMDEPEPFFAAVRAFLSNTVAGFAGG